MAVLLRRRTSALNVGQLRDAGLEGDGLLLTYPSMHSSVKDSRSGGLATAITCVAHREHRNVTAEATFDGSQRA